MAKTSPDSIPTNESSKDSGTAITQAVTALYEKRPYPHYPLVAKPRWQDGYLVSSLFSQTNRSSYKLAQASLDSKVILDSSSTPRSTEVLIAGSGEMLPYIIRRWEPRRFNVVSVDLSGRSLRRARIRLLFNFSKTEFHQNDINLFMENARTSGRMFRHVEAFGVFHHVADPEKTIANIVGGICPNGTMRAMLYNGTSRAWIHKVQDFLKALKYSAATNAEISASQDAVALLAKSSPFYAHRLKQMGPSILRNKTRFADTFLHPHEIRFSVSKWLNILKDSGLRVTGVFDRFGELDDLPNPLYRPPTADQLESRAIDLRYENNLEVFLEKEGGFEKPMEHLDAEDIRAPKRLKIMGAPTIWFSFPETEFIKPMGRIIIWNFFLNHLAGSQADLPPSLKKLPLQALQRLSRLGAIPITSGMPTDLKDQLLRPMKDQLSAPEIPQSTTLEGTKIEAWLAKRATEISRKELLKNLI